MATNRKRFDPYKVFNFRVVIVTALAAVAGFAVVKRLLPGAVASKREPKDYLPETSSGARPIEAVGTNTVGFVGTAPETTRKAGARRNQRKASGGS
jgi:hypothetical protein